MSLFSSDILLLLLGCPDYSMGGVSQSNWGQYSSTMSKVRDYLIRRRAIVSCASYLVDRSNFYGETEPGTKQQSFVSHYSAIPITPRHKAWPDAVRRHHAFLVNSLLQTGAHYNLDFPTFTCLVSSFPAGDIPYLSKLIEKTNIVRQVSDVSSTLAVNAGIFRSTALLAPSSWQLFETDGIVCRRYSKARIAFLPRIGEIRITVVPQLAMSDQITFSKVLFSNPSLNHLWSLLRPPCADDDQYYHEAIFRLLTEFCGVLIGEELGREIASVLSKELAVKDIQLSETDLAYVVGHENAQLLHKTWLKSKRSKDR